ncbi:MAG: glucose-1-phosphate thymidylyltransferase [Bdellovibrionales bacterium CG10_big_fil_rev_8_21_14_0_10_45_34]|nr:MAG: glucose-1-phosphate thymidylyltransferase [Bdellovibrionales bacterium CG10_big_fil_rev_8_21_14_0_10_45_34]
MKAILLAGGNGTRLGPLTCSLSKQLLPVYDKPVIFYPLSTIMLAGIRDIMVISTPRDIPMIESLLGDGSLYGINLSYRVQERPEGIAQAFLIANEFIENDSVCLTLGDNLFYGHDLQPQLVKSAALEEGASVFAYHVQDPERYGVVEFDADQKAISIEEKPKSPRSNWAVTGLYFYDKNALEYAKSLKPSARGELEITDLNRIYLANKALKVEKLGRGIAWLDMGTPDSLLSSGTFVQTLEKRQGLKIGCLEEIAYHKKFIDRKQLEACADKYGSSDYGKYLRKVLTQPF